MNVDQREAAQPIRRRRWLLGLDPIFEVRRSARNARSWDAENALVAIALFGDVTIDLSRARSAPDEITIRASAIFRDVTVIVPEGARVELDGGCVWGDLSNAASPAADDEHAPVVRVRAHSLAGDVTVRSRAK